MALTSFFLTEGKKILIHKKKSRFPFSATAHRDFEIFKKAVFIDFCGVKSLAEAKEFAPVESVEQPGFSKEEGRKDAPTSRDPGDD